MYVGHCYNVGQPMRLGLGGNAFAFILWSSYFQVEMEGYTGLGQSRTIYSFQAPNSSSLPLGQLVSIPLPVTEIQGIKSVQPQTSISWHRPSPTQHFCNPKVENIYNLLWAFPWKSL
jgi:hypothetical protein